MNIWDSMDYIAIYVHESRPNIYHISNEDKFIMFWTLHENQQFLKSFFLHFSNIVCFSKFSLFIAKVESLEDDSSGIICGNPEPLTYVWLRSWPC